MLLTSVPRETQASPAAIAEPLPEDEPQGSARGYWEPDSIDASVDAFALSLRMVKCGREKVSTTPFTPEYERICYTTNVHCPPTALHPLYSHLSVS